MVSPVLINAKDSANTVALQDTVFLCIRRGHLHSWESIFLFRH